MNAQLEHADDQLNLDPVPLERQRDLIRVEVSGKAGIGKSVIASLIAKTLHDTFPDHLVEIATRDPDFDIKYQYHSSSLDTVSALARFEVVDVSNVPPEKDTRPGTLRYLLSRIGLVRLDQKQ